MIELEKFRESQIYLISEWFKNKNNRLYQNTKTITHEKAKKLVESNDDKKVFLIKYNNNPIGYCMLKDINNMPKVGITIDEPYWGKGYGKVTMKLLEKIAKEKYNINHLGLTVMPKNERAINMYKNLGYNLTYFIMEKDI